MIKINNIPSCSKHHPECFEDIKGQEPVELAEFRNMKLVYPAHSKHYFYFRQHISKFLLERNCVPLNHFMIFEYFMLDTVERDIIRNANNNLIKKANEVWVFGSVSDGVLAEIILAKKEEKTARYFKIIKSKQILEITKDRVEFESGLEKYRGEL